MFFMQTVYKNHQDYYDSPSPAWIRYQKERHDPKYNKRGLLPPAISRDSDPTKPTLNRQGGNNGNLKKDMNGAFKTKPQTTSRHNSANIHQQKAHHPDENIYMDVKNAVKHQEQTAKEDSESGQNTNDLKYPSIKGFISFVKSLKNTWINKSLFRIEDKIQFLYNLKDTLMRTIGEISYILPILLTD